MEVVVTTGAVSRAKPQSNCHHQETNIQSFTGWMPFLSPNQQCQSTEGKISHSMDFQWLKWSCEAWGAHLTKPGWSKPRTHSTPNEFGVIWE